MALKVMCAKNSSDFMKSLFKCRHGTEFFHAGENFFYLNHNAGGLNRLYLHFFSRKLKKKKKKKMKKRIRFTDPGTSVPLIKYLTSQHDHSC